MADRVAVTGAYGYSGQHVARLLLDQGGEVVTLTGSPARESPLKGRVDVRPLCFMEPDRLRDALAGVQVLVNTYWVRFNHADFTHQQAVENSRALFRAAVEAGVKRVVHVSITNPSEHSPLDYFRGKWQVEQELVATGLSHAILRPAVLFGGEDILVNNMAWTLRTFPVIGVFGDGSYRLQPIHVEDFARLIVDQIDETSSSVMDAVGPETFTYRGLLEALDRILGTRRPIVPVPPPLGYLVSRLVGWWMDDVFVTWDEIQGLMGDLLHVTSAPRGSRRLTDWAQENSRDLGISYRSELSRRRDRVGRYL